MILTLKKVDGSYTVENEEGERLDFKMATTFWSDEFEWYQKECCFTPHKKLALAAIDVQRKIYHLEKLADQLENQQ